MINAKGTATRLSGGRMRDEVTEAMADAARHCVDMADLQAAASREIAAITGAEAGYVAAGASACLLLAAAACLAGLDVARMARLPDARGMPNEIVMVRSQRNGYDHAIRAAGATIVEVGLPDRHAGSGVRDAEVWEIEAALCEATAAIFYVADANALPDLPLVTALASRHNVPVIVDAAAQLPPQANLRRFVAEGADLVAFSGGKVIGGPQASGFLCGRRDLVMSAALQHLDLDVFEDMWRPPSTLIDRSRMKGVPPHGIGRSAKVGKEEIVGLLTALRLFVEEGDAVRHARWLELLRNIQAGLAGTAGFSVRIEGAEDRTCVPTLVLAPADPQCRVEAFINALIDGRPSIHVDASRRAQNLIVINPLCLRDADIPPIVDALTARVPVDDGWLS
ncbi:DegT/DnrJ/EryC1/StrS family aminotransferase [Chthonobacter albigriseus]|uniref:DegT/DnrJ/EryC1/StrS family aminotransferase n=1 Tax=Chthonobacter albigriseus TaxID=1683161 RepID=UPI0019D4F51F|nr:DegT/DnrJ/EryC1/StrS family aminotransferase [Chthonobacter albigriseus]